MTRANALTVDKEAFADALRCMYHLNKHKVAYTTNFKSLKEFCIGEIVEDIIAEAALFPYYSLIFDEATDIHVSVHKQLGL